MKEEILSYLQKIDGGSWSSKEKKSTLYNLVSKCLNEFDGDEVLSVELGVFNGSNLFAMAHAHKDRKNGRAVGVDGYDKTLCISEENHSDVNEFWAKIDFQKVRANFTERSKMEQWSEFVDLIVGDTRSEDISNKFNDNSIHLLAQDTSHNKSTIIRELQLWSPKIKKGGYWVISAANWGEAIDGYMQLPKFGFSLVKDYEGWEVWKKTGKVEEQKDVVSEFNKKVSNFIEPAIDTPKPTNEHTINKIEFGEQGSLNLAGFDIQPILIYIPDTDIWMEKFRKAKEHFASVGIKPLKTVPAIYGQGFGIAGTHEYNLDNPNGHHNIGVGYTALNLTMYMVYNIEMSLPNTHFLFLEGDTRCQPDFLEKLEEQLKFVPKDFDWLAIGHCCSNGKRYKHIGGDVYECVYDHAKPAFPVQHFLGGNCYIVAKKALPKIIETQRDMYAPCDISLSLHTFKDLKVYIIRPRMVEQENNNLPQ